MKGTPPPLSKYEMSIILLQVWVYQFFSPSYSMMNFTPEKKLGHLYSSSVVTIRVEYFDFWPVNIIKCEENFIQFLTTEIWFKIQGPPPLLWLHLMGTDDQFFFYWVKYVIEYDGEKKLVYPYLDQDMQWFYSRRILKGVRKKKV